MTIDEENLTRTWEWAYFKMLGKNADEKTKFVSQLNWVQAHNMSHETRINWPHRSTIKVVSNGLKSPDTAPNENARFHR